MLSWQARSKYIFFLLSWQQLLFCKVGLPCPYFYVIHPSLQIHQNTLLGLKSCYLVLLWSCRVQWKISTCLFLACDSHLYWLQEQQQPQVCQPVFFLNSVSSTFLCRIHTTLLKRPCWVGLFLIAEGWNLATEDIEHLNLSESVLEYKQLEYDWKARVSKESDEIWHEEFLGFNCMMSSRDCPKYGSLESNVQELYQSRNRNHLLQAQKCFAISSRNWSTLQTRKIQETDAFKVFLHALLCIPTLSLSLESLFSQEACLSWWSLCTECKNQLKISPLLECLKPSLKSSEPSLPAMRIWSPLDCCKDIFWVELYRLNKTMKIESLIFKNDGLSFSQPWLQKLVKFLQGLRQ